MLIPETVIPVDRYGLIYAITRRETGKQYVGQTVRPLKARWCSHRTGNSKSPSAIKDAIIRHGADAFDIDIVDWAMSKDELDRKEQFWIEFLDTRVPEGYNLREGGGSHGKMHPDTVARMAASRRGQKLPPDHPFAQKGPKAWTRHGFHLDETHRSQISETLKQRYAEGMVHPQKGKPVSAETRAKIARSLTGRKLPPDHPFHQSRPAWNKGITPPAEQRAAHSARMKAKYASGEMTNPNPSRPIRCIETGEVYPSLWKAAQYVHQATAAQYSPNRKVNSVAVGIRAAIKSGGVAYGFHWEDAQVTNVSEVTPCQP